MSTDESGASEAASFDQTVLARFMRRRVMLPCVIFAASILIYGACIAGAVFADSLAAKTSYAVLAGVFIANLAIIGHDAVHRSFTSVRWLNRAIGTVAFLPALHPYGLWEHHHNRVLHRYTAQIGVDNAYSPMTAEQYRAAGAGQRAYYRFMRSLAGQPFFYMVDIWLPKMFLPLRSEVRNFRKSDWVDFAIVHIWLLTFVFGLAGLYHAFSGQAVGFGAALLNASVFGFVIPFLVWNLFISFVTIVQHTGPNARWVMPTGRPSTHEQKLRGTVHVGFPQAMDWFFHRVMQHITHHVNPMVPMYGLKAAEKEVVAREADLVVIERWTPFYHWRMTRDCKLYDPAIDGWCDFKFQPTAKRTPPALVLSAR
jgi:omega-6 fatty acid desaturase (delta-12 desaturase)